TQGLADLAAQQALARVNAAVSAKQADSQTTDSNGTATDNTDAGVVDPVTAIDEMMNGIDDLVAATDQQTDGSDVGSLIDGIVGGTDGLAAPDSAIAGDVTADVSQIIDGTTNLLAPAAETADGSDLFAAIDSIINSFVAAAPPTVDVTA